MRFVMASIYDSKAEAWMQPMFFQSPAQAVRSFSDAVKDVKSEFGKHPEDYTLFELAAWDQRTGEILPVSAPVSLAVGIHLVDVENGQ